MALLNCPDCGTEVSDAAPNCPKCNRPMAKVERSKLWPWVSMIVVAIVYGVVAFVIGQTADIVFPALNFSLWPFTLVSVLLWVGFPVVLFFGWRFGQRRRSR